MVVRIFQNDFSHLLGRLTKFRHANTEAEFSETSNPNLPPPNSDLNAEDSKKEVAFEWLKSHTKGASNLNVIIGLLSTIIFMLFLSPVTERLICQRETAFEVPFKIVHNKSKQALKDVKLYVANDEELGSVTDSNGIAKIKIKTSKPLLDCIGCKPFASSGRELDIMIKFNDTLCVYTYIVQEIGEGLTPATIGFPTQTCSILK